MSSNVPLGQKQSEKVTLSSHWRSKHEQPVQRSPYKHTDKNHTARKIDSSYNLQPQTTRAMSSLDRRIRQDSSNPNTHRQTPNGNYRTNEDREKFESHDFDQPSASKKSTTPVTRHSVVCGPNKTTTMDKLTILWAKIKSLSENKLDMVMEFVKKIESNVNPTSVPKYPVYNSITDITLINIKVYSSWGCETCIGITEIDVFDMSMKKVDINASSVMIKNCEKFSNLESITDGVTHTTDAKHMAIFTTKLKLPLLISIPIKNTPIDYISIWNYNCDLNKGAKDVELFINGKLIWRGDLKKGSGDANADYNTTIIVNKGRQDRYNTIQEANKQPKMHEGRTQESEPHMAHAISSLASIPTIPADKMPENIFRRKSKKCLKIASPGPIKHEQPPKHIESKHNELIKINGSIDSQLQPFPPYNDIEKIGKLLQFESYAPSNAKVNKENVNISDIALDALINDSPCEIPYVPYGKYLTIFIYSNWGDKDFVGLMGLEFWDIKGNKIVINEKSITADPPDFNILGGPNIVKDPRVVSNLIRGDSFFTCDPNQCWMAPFISTSPNKIIVAFQNSISLSLIRLWNYNRSRIYTNRGVKDIEIVFDSKLIFKGEVKRASGNLKSLDKCCENILFTNDTNVINKITSEDWTNSAKLEDTSDSFASSYRPTTANEKKEQVAHTQSNSQITQIISNSPEVKCQGFKKAQTSTIKHETISCSSIEINITENWGDFHYTGLTGIEIYGIWLHRPELQVHSN